MSDEKCRHGHEVSRCGSCAPLAAALARAEMSEADRDRWKVRTEITGKGLAKVEFALAAALTRVAELEDSYTTLDAELATTQVERDAALRDVERLNAYINGNEDVAAALRDVAELNDERDELRKKGDALALELDVALRDVAELTERLSSADWQLRLQSRDSAIRELGALRERLREARGLLTRWLNAMGLGASKLDIDTSAFLDRLDASPRAAPRAKWPAPIEDLLTAQCAAFPIPVESVGTLSPDSKFMPGQLVTAQAAPPRHECPSCDLDDSVKAPPGKLLKSTPIQRAATPVQGAPLTMANGSSIAMTGEHRTRHRVGYVSFGVGCFWCSAGPGEECRDEPDKRAAQAAPPAPYDMMADLKAKMAAKAAPAGPDLGPTRRDGGT